MYGSSSSYFASIPTAEASDYRFHKPLAPSMPVDSYDRRLTPELQLYSTKGNKIIKFTIPNDAIFDFSESQFQATITVITDGVVQAPSVDPAYQRLVQGVFNTIERQRHTQDNAKLEERQNAWDIANVEWVFLQDPDYQNFVGTDLLGFGTRLERNALGADPQGTRYAIPVQLGLITSGPFAAKFFREKHVIEFYLNDPLICLETNCGNPEIQFTNLEWWVRCLASDTRCGSASNAYEDALYAYIMSGTFQVAYDSWQVQQNALTQASHDLLITLRAKALKWVLTMFQNLADRYNTQANDKLITYPRHGLLSYQFKVNGVPWPEQAVQTTLKDVGDYWYYLRWRESWTLDGEMSEVWIGKADPPTVSLDEYKVNEFLIVGDMRHLSDVRMINNLNTASFNQDMILQLRFMAAPPQNTAAFHLLCFTSIAKIEGNGSTRFCIEE